MPAAEYRLHFGRVKERSETRIVPPRYVLITGPRALQSVERSKPRPPLSAPMLDWMRTRGWMRSPDGSTPIMISPKSRGPGAAEQRWQDDLARRQRKP